MLVYKLTNLQKNSIPLHASFVINAHILQTALYRVNFNLATVLVSPYFRGLADATQLMATWSQKATWDARRKKGEVGMVAPGNSARGTVAKLMALRNFPHADANGDGWDGAWAAAPRAELRDPAVLLDRAAAAVTALRALEPVDAERGDLQQRAGFDDGALRVEPGVEGDDLRGIAADLVERCRVVEADSGRR